MKKGLALIPSSCKTRKIIKNYLRKRYEWTGMTYEWTWSLMGPRFVQQTNHTSSVKMTCCFYYFRTVVEQNRNEFKSTAVRKRSTPLDDLVRDTSSFSFDVY